MNKVIIFSAPSGSGKTTLVQHALSKFPQLEFSVTATTRASRGTEIHGRDYYFITEEDFKNHIVTERFVEFEEVYPGKFYGTLKSEIDRIFSQNKVVIFDVDVRGGIALKKYFGAAAMSIFIMAPSVEELENRLNARATDDAETIKTRVAKAVEEIGFKNDFDEVIINDDLQKAKEDVELLIDSFLKS